MTLARFVALTLALIVAGSTGAEAQGRGGGGRMNPAQMLLQDVTLTAAQQAQVDSVSAKYTAEMTAFREKMQAGGGGGMTAESRAEMAKMRTTLQTSLRAILTAEQQVVFDRNVEAMAQRQQRRPPPPRRR